METTVKERLITFISSIGISKNKFETICGLGSRYVSNISVSIQPDKIKKISLNFPQLNTGWLLTGEGEMLNATNKTGDIKGNNNTSIAGNGNKVHHPTDTEKFLFEMSEQRKMYSTELAEQRKLTEKTHEQMDRLLSQLEAKDAIINKLLK